MINWFKFSVRVPVTHVYGSFVGLVHSRSTEGKTTGFYHKYEREDPRPITEQASWRR